MSNKILYLLVSVVLVLIIGLAAAFFMMWNKLSSLDMSANLTADAQAAQQQGQNGMGPIYSLDTFIVNLADDGRSRYLRVTMDLELFSAADEGALDDRLPQVRDSILMILPSKQFEDIASMEGKTALRNEIITKLNGMFNKNLVSNIFFTEFVVQ
jgi:flagellar FliL protein